MIVHQIFAQIYNNEIKNIIVCDNYELANYLARATYGDTATAVDCLQYSCAIGDKFVDGQFLKVLYDESGNPTGETQIIHPNPTEEQEIAILKMEKEELESELSDTQMALVDLYEGML